MTTRQREVNHIIEEWKNETQRTEIDMPAVAAYAASKGWPIPPPISGLERLAKEFSQVAREVTRQDGKTGHEYRVYHAVRIGGSSQGVFWIDIDEAPRKHMVKTAYDRREQVIGDMVQLTLDLQHWNRVNPTEEPIVLQTDVTPDVNERLASSEGLGEDDEAV